MNKLKSYWVFAKEGKAEIWISLLTIYNSIRYIRVISFLLINREFKNDLLWCCWQEIYVWSADAVIVFSISFENSIYSKWKHWTKISEVNFYLGFFFHSYNLFVFKQNIIFDCWRIIFTSNFSSCVAMKTMECM